MKINVDNQNLSRKTFLHGCCYRNSNVVDSAVTPARIRKCMMIPATKIGTMSKFES